MNPEHDQIEAIMASALEIDGDDERQSYLNKACGNNSSLQARVVALIKNHKLAGSSFLAARDETLFESIRIPERSGTTLGPYCLQQKIGEGGMGVVYLAQQQHPVRRRVVIKIMKVWVDLPGVVARFERERQALAVMDHPNIARVIDGGTTDDGRPWFAMEWIPGEPITEYCDRRKLQIHQRLELLVSVCHAVQHAHHKGIIHRDLKPSNVLVTEIDGKPTPKVIDFGVAKAVGPQLTNETLNTQFGALIGTLEYMSPEQATMGFEGVDTRCDVYGLGVIMYELLTGTTPLQKRKLKDVAVTEVLRQIREIEPHRASDRLGTLEELPAVAANRGTEPKTLRQTVRSDLDWIVKRSLEKERDRRYSTANGLAEDIERFMRHEPVEAGPPGTTYRLRKFLRRNRWPVAAAMLLFLTLVGGVVGTSIGLIWAEQQRSAASFAEQDAQRQRDRAERHFHRAMAAVDRLLTRVAGISLVTAPRMDDTRRRILEDALEFYREILDEEGDVPLARRELALAWHRVGHIQSNLGQDPEAEKALKQAIEIQTELINEFPDNRGYELDLVESNRQLAIVFYHCGKFSECEQIVQRMLERKLDRAPATLANQASLQFMHGAVLAATQRIDLAIEACRKSLDLYDELTSQTNSDSGHRFDRTLALSLLGNLYHSRQRLDDAVQCFKDGIEALEKMQINEPDDLDVLVGLAHMNTNLGLSYAALKRDADAESANRKAIALFESISTDHPGVPEYRMNLARTYSNVALLHSNNGNAAQAAVENEKVLRITEEMRSRYPQRLEIGASYAGACGNQGKYLLEQDQLEESIVWNSKAIDVADELLIIEPRHSETRRLLHSSLMGRAAAYRMLNQRDLAVDDYRRTLALSEGESHAVFVNFRPRALSFAGDHTRATLEAEAIVSGKNATSSNMNEMAKVYATCIVAVSQDKSIDEDEQSVLVERYAARSIELLTMAAKMGHYPTKESVNDLRSDDRLQPLVDRDDFKKLLETLNPSHRP
jgi:eukaryotic-like serine/threonine-protein kinase